MRLDRYIAMSRIVDLPQDDLRGALEELLRVSLKRVKGEFDEDELLEALIQREHTMTTYLGNGVAMPHLRLPMQRPYLFAIGRVRNGVEYEGLAEYREIRLIVLLLASENATNYLNTLASLARLFKERTLVDHIVGAPDLETFRKRIMLGFGGLLAKPERKQNRFNRLILRESEKIAKASKCAAILIFSDTFAGGIEVTDAFPNFRTILVTRAARDRLEEDRYIKGTIEVRSYSKQRLSQTRSAILIGLTRGIFKYNDRLCCVGGLPASNQLDTLVVIDIEREFQSVLTREQDILPDGVKVEVIERMVATATELAVEGREGKPIGTLFVIGDTAKVREMVKPLVLNPFHGYSREDRNVLNPFMDETLKEFSVIDGCFVIEGDGVIDSAGSLIHAPSEYYHDMPSGFGARHSAAAAISRAADCLAICVSESSGQITLFRHGVMLPLLERPVASAV